MSNLPRFAWFCSLTLAGALTACDTDSNAGPSVPDPDHPGARVYSEPVADGNSFACATCHALSEPAGDGLRRPGHPLGDATARPSYKNGQLGSMLDAANSCLQEWMNAEPWGESDPRWRDLHAWLAGQAPTSAEPLAFEIVTPPADLSGGDAAAGRTTFNATCAACHAENATGTTQAPPLLHELDPSYVASRVRLSGRADSPVYPGLTGGIMPFWAADRLSDTELRDVVAWLTEPDGNADGSGGSGETSGGSESDGGSDSETGGDTSPSGCASTHPHIGWTAELQAFFHGVAGTATIVDDCTIEITDFSYDGTGIDVRIYGGLGGDYDGGFPMTDDLLLPGGYNGASLTATVPEGFSLDDLDGVSVWCVDVGIDFGSGMFGPP